MSDLTDYEKILNMNDQDAASILEKFLTWNLAGRQNSKTLFCYAVVVAVTRAIAKLREGGTDMQKKKEIGHEDTDK